MRSYLGINNDAKLVDQGRLPQVDCKLFGCFQTNITRQDDERQISNENWVYTGKELKG